jgi:hypothetical protein
MFEFIGIAVTLWIFTIFIRSLYRYLIQGSMRKIASIAREKGAPEKFIRESFKHWGDIDSCKVQLFQLDNDFYKKPMKTQAGEAIFFNYECQVMSYVKKYSYCFEYSVGYFDFDLVRLKAIELGVPNRDVDIFFVSNHTLLVQFSEQLNMHGAICCEITLEVRLALAIFIFFDLENNFKLFVKMISELGINEKELISFYESNHVKIHQLAIELDKPGGAYSGEDFKYRLLLAVREKYGLVKPIL